MKHRIITLLLLFTSLMGVQKAMGAEWLYDYSNWMCYPSGMASVDFVMPVFNYDKHSNNIAVRRAKITATVDGQDYEVLWFAWNNGTDRKNDRPIYMRASVGGTFTVLKSKQGPFDFDASSGLINFYVDPEQDDNTHYVARVCWTAPYEWMGKTIRLKLTGHADSYGGHKDLDIQFDDFTPSEPPATSPTLMVPMLAYDNAHMGKIMIPYSISVSKVHSLDVIYRMAGQTQSRRQPIENPPAFGMIYLPMSHPIDALYIEADVTDTGGNHVPGKVKSDSINVNPLHLPRNLAATVRPDGTALLTWDVAYPNCGDISIDGFEVQRCTSGSDSEGDAHWHTIDMVDLERGQAHYEYVDETLMQDYRSTAPRYRIRRQAASQWGWHSGAGVAQATVTARMTLPMLSSAQVVQTEQWNDQQHVVAVRYEQKDQTPVYDALGRFILRTREDWNALADRVAAGDTVNVVMANDITIENGRDKMMGDENHPFIGTFDGNGHMIYIDFPRSNQIYTAPFSYVAGKSSISNLAVDGRVGSSQQFSGGLIGRVDTDASVDIENCYVAATVTGLVTGDATNGGLIALMKEGSTVNISNSAFVGKMKGTNCHSNGGFIGWIESGSKATLTNCFFAGGRETEYDNCQTFARMRAGGELVLNNCYYQGWVYGGEQGQSAWGMSNEELIVAFETYDQTTPTVRSLWTSADDTLLPVMVRSLTDEHVSVSDERSQLELLLLMRGENQTDTMVVSLNGNEQALTSRAFTQELPRNCVDYDFQMRLKKAKSPLAMSVDPLSTMTEMVIDVNKIDADKSYRFVNNDTLLSLQAEQLQSSVLLEWTSTGNDHDFYRILRRKHSIDENAAWTDTLASDVLLMRYEDKTVQVQQVYDYRVESVFQCEGTHISALTATGQCAPTGMICGYVRMSDGTGMAGLTVVATPDSIVGADVYTAVTDDAGYFEISGMVYQGAGSYKVTVLTSGEQTSFGTQVAAFTTSKNLIIDFNFYMDEFFVYSGNVYFAGTTIPVSNVGFRLDGHEMIDGNGSPIVTNTMGRFELSIPKGTHRVQAFRQGHTFENDGYLLNLDSKTGDLRDYQWKENVAGVRLWDETRVVLQGRVVGGNDQGQLPLGESLSKNNLGDNLRIVMQLEGDNASYIVFDRNDDNVKERTESVAFGYQDKDTTVVHSQRHSITVTPDAKTGEFRLKLPPVKLKVTEVSAQGYPTLFKQGKVGETLDLGQYANDSVATYSFIYHAVPTLDVKQYNSKNEQYFGLKQTVAKDNIGNVDTVKVWNAVDGSYSFGYPVFMAGATYGWMLQACEKYYYNNNPRNTADIVRLKEGKVVITNTMVSADDRQTLTLDSIGGASYVFMPQVTTVNLDGDNALHGVGITLEYDGSFYDVKPLNGEPIRCLVMATRFKDEGRTSIAVGVPHLFDILRDPPGASSSSYIEEGSKLSYSYTPSFSAKLGVSMGIKLGTSSSIYGGTVTAPGGQGNWLGKVYEHNSLDQKSFSFTSGYDESWTRSYTIDVNERIQTSTSKKWVGPKADLFIGINENMIIQDAIAVRAIPENQYLLMKNNEGGSFETKDGLTVKVKTGAMKKLAEGQDADGNKVYLVRDEVLAAGSKVKSTFIHSQHYIENELLPELLKVRNALILPPDTTIDCQSLANSQDKMIYQSLLPAGDLMFGSDSSYVAYYPADRILTDSVQALNSEIRIWVGYLQQNEEEKLLANDLVKNYDFDGAANIQLSENFTSSLNYTGSVKWPGKDALNGIFDGVLSSAIKKWEKTLEAGDKTQYNTKTNIDDEGNPTKVVWIRVKGKEFELKFTPVLSFSFNDKSGRTTQRNKKVGFTLSASSKSSYNIDVYRTRSNRYDIDKSTAFTEMTLKTLDELRYGQPFHPSQSETDVFSTFVFRTRGGTTCQPYEDERRTKWYNPGQLIDVKTVEIDKLRIWVDQPTVSNVPFGEPARYTIHFANESDYPERASLVFNYFMPAKDNPKGAKVLIDGSPVDGTGSSIVLWPAGTVFTKQVELWPAADFDYENVGIALYDPEDAGRVYTVYLNAHFVPSAGNVLVSTPGDKWVINTESQYDKRDQRYYMPVRIEGFDVNYRGFDHIELQYKLSTQGDRDWVNVCSYYNDKQLMAEATGQRDTIPSSGIINAAFYGEAQEPVEQYYDLRAVVYCRHAGGFLTGASPVLSGVKDTRRPS